MKLFFSFFLFFNLFTNVDLVEIRKMYPIAVHSEDVLKTFVTKLEAVENKDAKTLVAYKGASMVLQARFVKKIVEKKSLIKEGIKLIEFAAVSEPNTIEIRVIRLSIQENIPKAVNYSHNKEEDKKMILTKYEKQSGALKEYIKNFILQSISFSEEEKQAVK